MEKRTVSRRGFFKKAAVLTGAAAAVYSVEENNLFAFQQRQGGPPREEDVVPHRLRFRTFQVRYLHCGGVEVSRLIAGHNLIVGQAHESGSGLIYISSLLRAYFTEDKVLETFAMYEKHGINTSGARMAANNSDWAKKYMAKGGKLSWMAGISSENDIPMAVDMGCKLGYVHGNTSDAAIRQANGTDLIAKTLDAIRKAKMAGGICCHSLEVVTSCEKAGIKPDFYIKTYNPVNFYMTGGEVPASAGGSSGTDQAAREKAAKEVIDVMASVKVPWVGFKVLAAGRVSPNQAFADCFKNGCDALLVGMYDFQVAAGANMAKKILQEKDKLGRTRPWIES